MLATMARGTFLLMVAAMVVAWIFSLSKSEAQAPANDQPAEQWSIYS